MRGRRGVRRAPGEHLVRDARQWIEIAATVELLVPGGLLGGHVLRSANAEPGLGEPLRPPGSHRERDAEIRDQDATVLQKDVYRFDVMVDDTARVRVVAGRPQLRQRCGCRP